MCKLPHLVCSWCSCVPGALNNLRIFLIIFICQLVSVNSLQGQYLLEEFKPKIKGAPHTAKHIVQDDGKIVMLGDYAFVGDTPAPNLLRFNPDGSLDNSFILSEELRGQFTTDFRQCCSRANVVQGPGGDLVLLQAGFRSSVTIIDESGTFKADIAVPAGYFQFERLIKHKDGYIAIVHLYGSDESIFRLDQNGNVDPTFARIDFSGYVDDIMVDLNNNIFIAGNFTIAGISRNLVKISELGVLDNTFNNVPITVSFAEIDLFPDGKILVSSGNEIVLLDVNGNKIESFTPETNGERIYSSVVDPVNNRIIILLEQYPLPVAVKALELDGSLSDSFTSIDIDLGSANALARILHINQKFILTTGYEMEYENSHHSFLVFDGLGNVDTEISTKEKLFNVGHVNTAVELEDGNLIIGGAFSHIGNIQVNNLAKLDKTGNIDSTFVSNNPLSLSDEVREIKFSPDSQLYIGGFFHDILRANTNSLIRMNTDGELDSAFVTTLTSWASYMFLDDFIIMSDRVIACGFYNGAVVAFDFNGNVVPTFKTNIFGSQYVAVNSLCKVDDNNFAIGGNILNEEGFLWIMDIDGNIDNSFVRQDSVPISSEYMVKVGNELFRSGVILGGQSSSTGNFIYNYNLETGGIESTKLATSSFSVNHHVLPLNDSMVVISGEFNQFNNSVANNFAVSDYDGTNNERFTFQVSPGIVGHSVAKSILLSDEKILLVGKFDKINDEPFYSIAILNYTNFEPQVNVDVTYSVPEDTSFYLSDLIEVVDIDDEPTFSADQNENLTIGENGLVTLKQNFTGSIELQFNVKDSFAVVGPFTTTLEVQPVNDAPVINGQLEVPNILPGDNYEVGFGILDVVDVDGDNLTLTVLEGENYALVAGTSILSDVNFNGKLDVGVSVSDGLLTSEVFILSIGSAHPTGIEEVDALAFYPNPFIDYIRINAWQNIEHLSILSITGQELIAYDHLTLKESSGIIQAGKLQGGIFLLRVALKTKETRNIKLIKK